MHTRRGVTTSRRNAMRDERGTVLVVVILLIALMLSLGAAGTRTAQIELRIAHNDIVSKQALETAEAGWSHAYALLRRVDTVTHTNGAANGFNDELSGGGTGGALAALGSVRTLSDGNSYRFNHTAGQTGPDDGYYVRVVDNQDETTGADDAAADRDNVIHIISRGRVGTAERVIDMVVQRDGTAACVVCGNIDFPLPIVLPPLDVSLLGSVLLDSYDSRDGPYSPATATNHGNVFSNGDVSLTGTVALPVNVKGTVTAARSVQKLPPILQNVIVTGGTTQFAPPVEFPPVLPCGPPYPPNTGLSGGLYDRATGILVDVGVNDVISFAPGEYCFSAIVMAGVNSTLRVTGPTRISLTLPSTIVGIVNTTGTAANLRIESSVTSPLPILPGIVPALTIVGVGGNVAMVVNAPQAIVAFAGVLTPNFFGQIIGGMVPNLLIAQMHYDESLGEVPRLYRRGWRELREYPPA
jgi:hypothetical protein